MASRAMSTIGKSMVSSWNLLGIDSAMCPAELRKQAWAPLARDLPLDRLDAIAHDAPLADLPRPADEILKGRVRLRLVISVNVG